MILEIVSAEAKLFQGEITSITLPGVDGSFQILNNHAPIVSLLKEGTVKIAANSFDFISDYETKFKKVSNQLYALDITSGTIEMKDNKLILLAD
jgi:F-type H+-transporting ATPase subunit epsilon